MRGRGSIRPHRGGYIAQISLGTDENGKRVRLSAVAKTAEAAQLALSKMVVDAKRGKTKPKRSGKTIGAYLDEWLAEVATRRKPSTVTYYRDVIRIYLKPHVGDVGLLRFSPAHARKMHTALADLSASTRRKAHFVLRVALNDAYKHGLVTENPMLRVDPPRYRPHEMRALSEEEARIFVRGIANHRREALILQALSSGARQGELLALRRRDVDVVAGTAAVVDAKTDSGIRPIELHPKVIELIQNTPGDPDDLVFGPIDRRNFLRREWYPLLKKIDLDLRKADFAAGVLDALDEGKEHTRFPRIRFHDLRHTCATLLLKAGVHPKVVQERLGHGDISVTLGTYAHVVPSMQRDATNTLSAILGN